MLRRAVELFNRQGYDATSMGDLARELGLSKSAIYHHVDSKEQLLSAALDEALDELTAAVEQAVDPASTDPASTRLEDVVHRSVRILVTHRPAVTLLLRVRGNSEVELAALRRRRKLDEDLAGLVAEAAEEGAVRSDIAPELTSRLLFGLVNSLVEWYRPDGPVDVDTLARSIAVLAFDGLRVPPAG
ncbi:Transcriptional regulator, TetR family [Nocardioides sp. AX2bis]|nr:Transcriptional regulator, TetR family [Nocardioides sp. AX2bis]